MFLLACEGGKYSDTHNVCTPCAAGTYASEGTTHICTPCPSGI